MTTSSTARATPAVSAFSAASSRRDRTTSLTAKGHDHESRSVEPDPGTSSRSRTSRSASRVRARCSCAPWPRASATAICTSRRAPTSTRCRRCSGTSPRASSSRSAPRCSYVEPGDHVITCLSVFCGNCEFCLSGRPALCTKEGLRRGPTEPSRLRRTATPIAQFLDLSSFAEQMLVHENAIVKIRKDMPLDRAALIGCGVTTGVGAVFNTAKVEPGATVAVIGCGGVGLSAIQGAAHRRRGTRHRGRHARRQARARAQVRRDRHREREEGRSGRAGARS